MDGNQEILPFTIDMENKTITDPQDPKFFARIQQTQSGFIRNECGEIIELEILHRCITREGEIIIIDASEMFDAFQL